MASIKVKCPSCNATLAVPEGQMKRYIRCGACKHKFPLSRQPESVIEDVVASWLTDDDEPQPDDKALLPDESVGDESLLLHPEGASAPAAVQTPAQAGSAAKGNIRCVKVEPRGALFEFPASRLRDPDFRSAFPRQCLSCDARTHLRAHVVIFSSQLTDSISMEAEHSAGTLILSNEEVVGLSGQEVLDRLHKVPNVPPPADLPVPYWVCDMCSGSGTVRGQIQVNPDTGKGWCRLLIRNHRRSLDFMVNAGGQDGEGYGPLKERVDQTAENPWNSLPEAVQHRIQQWFKPNRGEHFIAYVPDRDHVRAEDGMAGVLISDQRLIHHTPRRHRESPISKPVELEHAAGAHRERVSIKTPGWEVKHMTVDRNGITRMRRGLSLGKFQAVWH